MHPTSHTGKIGRLPSDIREALNSRLLNGESGQNLIAWLNALPDVRAILAAEFAGRPINAPNLTAWRQGGYRQWLDLQETRRLAREMNTQAQASTPTTPTDSAHHDDPDPTIHPSSFNLHTFEAPVSDKLGYWIATQFCTLAATINAAHGEKRMKLVRQAAKSIIALRRADHFTAQRDIQRQWQQIAEQRNACRMHKLALAHQRSLQSGQQLHHDLSQFKVI